MIRISAVLLSVIGSLLLVTHSWADSQSDARKALEAKRIPVTEGEFLRQVERGDKSLVELFLQAGINANANVDGGSALTLAAVKGHADIAQMLIAKGADVYVRNKEGLTPLMGAIIGERKGSVSLVSLLLDRGADVNATTATMARGHAITPLFIAIQKGDKDLVQFLITRGANVNQKGNNGDEMSPLAWAQLNKQQDIANLLAANGAKP